MVLHQSVEAEIILLKKKKKTYEVHKYVEYLTILWVERFTQL